MTTFARLVTWARALLFGFDFFIAYRSADGGDYAQSLFRALRNKGFDPFIDASYYEAGGNLPRMQTAALLRSTKLLVIVSPRAHRSPPKGTDWLLAEVVEFKTLRRARRATISIVPIGTVQTLSARWFPRSRLLPELPGLDRDDICVLDEAVRTNTEVADATVAKLETDFTARRRRTLRLVAAGAAALLVTTLGAVSAFYWNDAAAARRGVALGEASQLLDWGKQGLQAGAVSAAGEQFRLAGDRLQRLHADPLPALHSALAADLRTLHVTKLSPVEEGVDLIRVSGDGDLVLVIYDYANYGGNPEPIKIPTAVAVGLFRVSTREWVVTQTVASAVGQLLYAAQRSRVVAVESPHHVILASQDTGHPGFERLSLTDGHVEPYDDNLGKLEQKRLEMADTLPVGDRADDLAEAMRAKQLFTVSPDNGIDVEYGPRRVDQVHVVSADGQNAIVGTYEGRVMLWDLARDALRSEGVFGPVFAAAFAPDGRHAYFCDTAGLFQIDLAPPNAVRDISIALRTDTVDFLGNETLLGVTLTDDGSTAAVATTHRLMMLPPAGTWTTWALPKRIARVADLRIDPRRQTVDLIVADDGTLVSGHYGSADSGLVARPSPTKGEAAVGWFEPEKPVAWIAAVTPAGNRIVVRSIDLAAPLSAAIEQPIVLPPSPNGGTGNAPMVHAIARIDNEIVVLYGDKELFRDSEMLDERMLRVSLTDHAAQPAIVVFPVAFERDDLGEPHWSVRHGLRILRGSRTDHVMVLPEPRSDIVTIGRDGKSTDVGANLASLASLNDVDGGEAYALGVTEEGREGSVAITLAQTGRGLPLRYALPGVFTGIDAFAVFARDGRRAAVAGSSGRVVVIDVSGYASPKP